jgi:hypothetical protein
MSTNAKDFKEVAPVLSAFFEWCEIEGILKNTKALRNRLEELGHSKKLFFKLSSLRETLEKLFIGSPVLMAPFDCYFT